MGQLALSPYHTFTTTLSLRLQLPAHHFHGDRKSLRDVAAQVTQLQTRYGMTGTMQTEERGGAGGAQPPLIRSHYIRYNFNVGCSAAVCVCVCVCVQRRLRPIFCDPQDHTLLV